MSVSPQELLRRISANSRESSRPSTAETSDKRFCDLLRIDATDEKPRDKDFFAMVEEEEDKEPLRDALSAVACALSPLFRIQDCPSTAEMSIASVLSADIEALFEKMAACMIIMNASHEVETTLILDNPSSMFCGTRITIREFSTAPKNFNIEIASKAQTIATIDAAKNDLLAAFQNGKFNFSIHRLDTEIEHGQERPVLHRKDSRDDEQQEQTGGRDP